MSERIMKVLANVDQGLTEEQKLKARTNIGAIGGVKVADSSGTTELVPDENGKVTVDLTGVGGVPPFSGSDNGLVLGVVGSSDPELQWVSKGGGGTSYTAGDGIDIDTNDVISAKVDGTSIGVNASGELESLATVDQHYNASSTNAQSGTAVAEAVSSVSGVPSVGSGDDGKVLTADYTGGSGTFSWQDPPAQEQADWAQTNTSAVDFIKNKPTINNVPAVGSSDDGKVLTADYTGGVGSYSWVTPGGGTTYTAGNGIDITNDVISAKLDGSTLTNGSSGLSVTNPVPDTTGASQGDVLSVGSSGLEWVAPGGSGGDIFLATYGTTTFSEISAASEGGKAVFLYYAGGFGSEGYLLPLCGCFRSNMTTSSYAYFAKPTRYAQGASLNPYRVYAVNGSNSWTSSWVYPCPNPSAGDVNKVLTCTGSDSVEWVAPSGGSSYSAGSGISIANDTISAKVDGSTITVNSSGELQATASSLQTKPLVAGTGITLTASASDVTISSDSSLIQKLNYGDSEASRVATLLIDSDDPEGYTLLKADNVTKGHLVVGPYKGLLDSGINGGSGKGNATTPLYIDGNGTFQPCNSLSAGSRISIAPGANNTTVISNTMHESVIDNCIIWDTLANTYDLDMYWGNWRCHVHLAAFSDWAQDDGAIHIRLSHVYASEAAQKIKCGSYQVQNFYPYQNGNTYEFSNVHWYFDGTDPYTTATNPDPYGFKFHLNANTPTRQMPTDQKAHRFLVDTGAPYGEWLELDASVRFMAKNAAPASNGIYLLLKGKYAYSYQ